MGDRGTTHFSAIYWYVVGISVLVLLYVASVTFLPIPKENTRFVDIAFGFLLNLLVSAGAYLTGGTPSLSAKKSEDTNLNLPPENKSEVTTTIKSEPLIPGGSIKPEENV
jgi:hypothetical protein